MESGIRVPAAGPHDELDAAQYPQPVTDPTLTTPDIDLENPDDSELLAKPTGELTSPETPQGAQAATVAIDTMFGLPLDKIARVSRALGAASVRTGSLCEYNIQRAPDFISLLEHDPATPLTPEIHKQILHELAWTRPGLNTLYKIPRARRVIDAKIDEQFPAKANEALANARKKVEEMAPTVEHLAGFENPKKQFESEVEYLTKKVLDEVYNQSRQRRADPRFSISPSHNTAPERRGLSAIIGKVFKFIRSIFKPNRPDPKTTELITPYDLGTAASSVLKQINYNLLKSDEQSDVYDERSKKYFDKMPMFKEFATKIDFSKIANIKPDKLAFVAPELLQFLGSCLPRYSWRHREIYRIQSEIAKVPHDWRFVERFKDKFGKVSLRQLRYAANNLIPALSDVIPSSGKEIQDIYDNILNFLDNRPDFVENPKPEPKPKPKSHFWPSRRNNTENPTKNNLLKRLFRRNKNQVQANIQ